jgi:hypothetical protein
MVRRRAGTGFSACVHPEAQFTRALLQGFASLRNRKTEAGMAVGSALTRGVRMLVQRDFWTFKVIHAVFGGLLTITGACGGIFVTEQIRKQISDVDSTIADAARRVDSIERALYQFQLLQTQGVLLGALSTGGGLREEFRSSFLQLGFLIRKGPTARMIQELNSTNLPEFHRIRAMHEKLVEAAVAGNNNGEWNELLKFEVDHESRLRDLQYRFLDTRYALSERRRNLERWLDRATTWGFILQQLGFVIVLLAGLIYQHGETQRAPAPRG